MVKWVKKDSNLLSLNVCRTIRTNYYNCPDPSGRGLGWIVLMRFSANFSGWRVLFYTRLNDNRFTVCTGPQPLRQLVLFARSLSAGPAFTQKEQVKNEKRRCSTS
jgi:hypothetical protein